MRRNRYVQFRLTWIIYILKKEVIQPQVPLRLPCYDFTPVTNPTLDVVLLAVRLDVFWLSQLPWCDGRCVQGPGTYSPRHADPRLLAIPTSCTRVAEYNPNWDGFLGFARGRPFAAHCHRHCSTCVAQSIRAMRT